jgi:hypothetical protein
MDGIKENFIVAESELNTFGKMETRPFDKQYCIMVSSKNHQLKLACKTILKIRIFI